MGNQVSLVGAQWSWGCVHIDSVSLVLPSLCDIPASPLRSRNTHHLFCCSYFAFRTRLPVSFCFISAACGLSYSFTFHCEQLCLPPPPRNTDDPLFVLNHSFDHNSYATGIIGIFKSFHVHFCGPQIYIPMKIPKTAQLKKAFCQMYHVLVWLMMGKIACSMFRVLRHLVTDLSSTAYRTATM